MFSAQFIFKPGTYDDEFHRLDAAIDAYAASLEGFLGVERWLSPDGTTKNSTYYFADRATIQTFASFPDHVEAKSKVARWYDGYQVIISEVIASYGDCNISTIAGRPKK
jgi:heme-degrading monooxygenase HmoA